MSRTFKKVLKLSADSIVAVPAGFKGSELIVFNPDSETTALLEKLNVSDDDVIYQQISLIDKWDDGSLDTHVSTRSAQVLRCIHDSGKSKTWLVTVRYL